MAIMLINRWEFIDDFCSYIIWWNYYNNLPLFPPSHFLVQLLIISLQPYILVELSECQRQPKSISNSGHIFEDSELSIEKMQF